MSGVMSLLKAPDFSDTVACLTVRVTLVCRLVSLKRLSPPSLRE